MKTVTGYTWAKRNKTAQLVKEMAGKKRNKFNAVKVKIDGIQFDSKAEAKRYGELKLLQKAGEISHLACHIPFQLIVNGHEIAWYTADFAYFGPNGQVVEDVKSPATAQKRDFRLIWKLMWAIHGIKVQIIGARSPASPPIRKAA